MRLSTAAQAEVPPEREDYPSAYYGPTNFTWLVKGRLGGCPRPGLVQTVEADAASLRRIGVTLLVSLTEEWQPPVSLLADHGLDSLHVPIPDMMPPTRDQAERTCRLVAEALEQGQSVAFHCRAGRGRTGTLLAAMLLWYRPDLSAAITRVKTANRFWIESPAQMDFLKDFAADRSRTLDPRQDATQRERGPMLALRQDRPKRRSEIASSRNRPAAAETAVWPIATDEGKNMSLDKALQKAMSGVPECLASGYVDMETGMLLGVQTLDSHPQEVLDMLAAATADLFQGSSVVAIEDIFKQARGSKSGNHYFNEILVFSENLIHVFMRTKKHNGHVVSFVCRKSANPGMVLTKARMSLEAVADAL